MLTGAILLAGRYFSQNMTLRRRQLEALVAMAGRMGDEIRYNGSDVCTLVERLGREPLAQTLPFLTQCTSHCRMGKPFPNAWQSALEEVQQEMHLSNEAMAQLSSFGSRLGATDLEGQMAHCGRYQREFERLLIEAREQERIKSRLYRSLSMLAGAAVIILLI